MKGWELVSRRMTWVDPHHQKRSHAWVGRLFIILLRTNIATSFTFQYSERSEGNGHGCVKSRGDLGCLLVSDGWWCSRRGSLHTGTPSGAQRCWAARNMLAHRGADPSITQGSAGRPSGIRWTPNLPTWPVLSFKGREWVKEKSFLTPSRVPWASGGAYKSALSASTFLLTDKSVLPPSLTNPRETSCRHQSSFRALPRVWGQPASWSRYLSEVHYEQKNCEHSLGYSSMSSFFPPLLVIIADFAPKRE